MVRYWPRDQWDVYLYTYRRKPWYSGMSEQLGENWIACREAPGDQGAGVPNASGKPPDGAPKGRPKPLWKRLQKRIHMRYIRLMDQQMLSWGRRSTKDTSALTEWAKPDVVVSVFEPLAANLIARRIATRLNIPWICYFRDHCTTYNEIRRVPGLWHLQAAYDRYLHGSLHSLIGVSPPFVRILSTFYRLPLQHAHMVTGCFDVGNIPESIRESCIQRRRLGGDAETATAGKPRYLRVSYAGNLYRHREESLAILLRALGRLSDEGVPLELTLWLSNAGGYPSAEIRNLVEGLETSGARIIFGTTRIPYPQALEMLNSADVNIVVEGIRPPHSEAGTLTLKVFDLMMIAKPTIALCAATLPIGEYLRKTGIGTDCADVDVAARLLSDVWQWRNQGRQPDWYAPDDESIEAYSGPSMARRISEIATRILPAADG